MLSISNTLTGKKESLLQQIPGEIGLYVCGMTVYDDCHIGHARSAIIFDTIRNYLEYKGQKVRYVKNYTDVDDKIIHRAQVEGRDFREVAEQFIASYEEDMGKLGVRPPTLIPKATDHIPEMLDLIADLVSKDMAYPVEGDVYFKVSAFPAYGLLSHQKTDELKAGTRITPDPRKQSPLDFVLWKSAKPGEPSWPSPWGPGRPGWHIECSAMAIKYLGATIDIHGGGEDLVFPHHENEIAQSEASTGLPFASCWVHHGFVTIDQEKMSKSLGNFFTVKEIFLKSARFPEQITAELLRFYLLSTHYRSPIDFSDHGLKVAKSGLDNFYTLFQKVHEAESHSTEQSDLSNPLQQDETTQFRRVFEVAMDDDFNTAVAMASLQNLRSESNRLLLAGDVPGARAGCQLLLSLGKLLGLFQIPDQDWSFQTWDLTLEGPSSLNEVAVANLISEREEARRQKDWGKSDKIRERLAAAGIVIEDRPDGTTRVKK